jgi:preprotein translocase subunit SecB
MTDDPKTPQDGSPAAGGPAAGGEKAAPPLSLITQYVKDLSFENPRAPESIAHLKEPPKVNLKIEVHSRNWRDNKHEVVLYLKVDTTSGGEPVFITELTYAGLFAIGDVPQDSMPLLLYVQCPQFLFPFARRVISDAVRDGGFPPLNIGPIDFLGLHQQRLRQQQQAADAPAPSSETAN